ncbi:MAG TPA: 3'-5' exonuclease [Casimicrobiaceae bacterium]
MTPTLAFDIETVPDVAGLRRVYALPAELSDADVLDWALQQRRAATGTDFLPPHLQRVVAIACVLREGALLRIASVGAAGDPEAELIRRFFDLVDKHTPQLVSWNGGGFDLPVLGHRALIHGVTAAKFWDWGDDDREFKFNSYLGRYHTRHLDLMDVLSMYQPRNYAGLEAMARLAGFPGKLGLAGSEVHAAFLAGRIEDVRRYCEADVLNTYLLYLRFQLLRGTLSPAEYASEVSLVREKIGASKEPHWREFLAAWDANPPAA